ncbi:cobaltochelatase subunit CobN [Acetobacter thailandicus]|uniref:cobaltochelatase subunit CobN n=1 Tax=Acetobacter thailandicus TaxID=1502842 RepID=UPI001BA8C139|nr:cobaltochelatase subunit CobN [Acetobacter thailandicus]MBS0981328.1 cobaltochelatase subunit CobN [Acetobacter thailandicus]
MHLLVRENRTLDEQDQAEDLGLDPAELIVLSFTETDLLGLRDAITRRAAEHAGQSTHASIQVVPLARLRHPMSVDLFIDTTLSQARCVVVRLLGGLDYWRYGAEELSGWCRAKGVPLVFLPGDCVHTRRKEGEAEEDDPLLASLSTIDPEQRKRLIGFFRYGGPRNMTCALEVMEAIVRSVPDAGQAPEPLPDWGVYRTFSAAPSPVQLPSGWCAALPEGAAARVVVVFYRAHLLVGDHSAPEELARQLSQHGCRVDMVFVTSLRDTKVAGALNDWLAQVHPDCLVNATVFSSRDRDGQSPLLSAGVPVIQLLQPGTIQGLWQASARGLSRADLAMQVVLPELDGSIASFPVSFREETAPGQPASRQIYAPGTEQAVARIMGWLRLRCLLPEHRQVGLVLSDYPGAGVPGAQGCDTGHTAHAVGLDSFASLSSILRLMQAEGYETGILPTQAELVQMMTLQAPRPVLSLDQYRQLTQKLPPAFMQSVCAAWGEPEDDSAVHQGVFHLRVVSFGAITLAVQPDRGRATDRKAQYHDPDSPPCHAYIAFYLWLRVCRHLDVMVHLGTHGTLEWLPGKAAALSPSCSSAVLTGGLPVIYPFIVNNPGEAAAARRRLGAVTIGHMTPPVMQAGLSEDMQILERLIDEYAEADGLDFRRGALLRQEILERATRTGVLAESGVRPGDEDEDEALARLDAYLCDVKDLQIRDGLHIFGQRAPGYDTLVDTISQACGQGYDRDDIARRVTLSAEAEANALRDALAGRLVPAGPAGAPTRGRADVLPTGRNLFTLDPRALPTPSAMQLAAKMEKLLLTRHLQEQGEPLTHLVMDLWGSSSLRTGGEDMALALRLMGVEITRKTGTGHVQGFEIIPLAVLDRPRVDVTLRISGLFRDAFPDQIALFDQVVSAVAARDEAAEWNPLAASVKGLEGDAMKQAGARIFGAAMGSYGTGVEAHLHNGTWGKADELGQAWLKGSAWTYGGGRDGQQNIEGLAALLQRANAVLHVQDYAETDMLESPENAAHEGGLAAAAASLGARPALWHGDTSRPDAPRLRATEQEVARIVRGRLANPRWIEGMQRHGYAGAAEMTRGVEALHGFAATVPARFDRQFDLVFARTLGDESCSAFLQKVNPAAWEAMRAWFTSAMQRGLWHPRSNSVAAALEGSGESSI